MPNPPDHVDPDDDRTALGERLRDAREYVGFSQEEIASFLDVPRSAVSLMESGQRKVGALELKRLAQLYGRPVAYFTGEATAEAAFDSEIQHLARKVSSLSADDKKELARFADFLQARKKSEGV